VVHAHTGLLQLALALRGCGRSIAAHASLQISQHTNSRPLRAAFSAIGYATALIGKPATLHRRQRVNVIVRQGSE
jgi:hypothetical protein